ncbi:MAG: SpoIIE family protein phosphatase [bacterium]|nr:SpoIIE family protein phosphatase [bacterium]
MLFRRKKNRPAAPVRTADPTSPPADDELTARPSTQFLKGDASEDRRSVQVLLDAIARVSESRDLESLLGYVVDKSIEATGAERGFLVMLDGDGEQVVRVGRQRGESDIDGEIKYSTSVVRRVLEEDAPMRTTVQSDAEALELGASVFDLKLRAVMCVPLTPEAEGDGPRPDGAGLERGALYVDSKAATREFNDEDLSLFHALAQHIAIALENARLNMQSLEKAKLEQSLEIASEIQSGLMPKIPDGVPGFDVYGWYRSAEHASGDFYDFVKTKDGRLAVVVGDVSGHGIGPALITATAQASLRSYVKVLSDPGSVFTMLNQDLTERMDDGMFLTLFMALLGKDGHVDVLNAGHTPPLLWRSATQTIESIAGSGPALGMMDDFEYDGVESFTLEPGDTLLAFTDGLVEARHPSRPDRMFDESGVRAELTERARVGASAAELTEGVVQNVLEFTGGYREDDMTIVAARRS